MPSSSPRTPQAAATSLDRLGASIRERRKALHVSAATAAEAAGMSRVTLHRIERGEASVTMGAYANALAALGLQLLVRDGASAPPPMTAAPEAVQLADYPQLRQLAWHAPGGTELTPEEALGVYERNWRHLDQARLEARERALIDALIRSAGKGHLLV